MLAMYHQVAAALAVGWTYFCVHFAPFLAATLLPTILAGLMKQPGADGSKAVKVIKLLIRGCGWAVHYDEPGSVKLPFVDLLLLLWKGAVMVYRVFRPAPTALLVAAFVALAGCAGGLNGVRQSLTDSAKLLQASADTFQRADLAYQRSLEARADARAAIDKYRFATQPKILKAFVDAGAGLALAVVTCAAVEQGTKTKQDLTQVMREIWPLLRAVQDALMTISSPAAPVPKSPPVPTSTRWRPPRHGGIRVAWDRPLECETRDECREITWPANVPEEVL